MGGSFDENEGQKEVEDVAQGDALDSKPDYDRDLGVIEAITMVTRSCPNGGVIRAAERALEAIKAGGPDVLKQQAYFVLIAIKGWRGERARQVHRSLTRYLDQGMTARDGQDPSES